VSYALCPAALSSLLNVYPQAEVMSRSVIIVDLGPETPAASTDALLSGVDG